MSKFYSIDGLSADEVKVLLWGLNYIIEARYIDDESKQIALDLEEVLSGFTEDNS